MDSNKIVSKKILIVAFLGTLTISFFIGSMSSSDTQACLTLYIQLEPDAFDERNNKGDKLQSDFFKKSVHNNIICTLNNITNLRELFQTRKFWLPSFLPRPPPKFYKFPLDFSHYLDQFLLRPGCTVA